MRLNKPPSSGGRTTSCGRSLWPLLALNALVSFVDSKALRQSDGRENEAAGLRKVTFCCIFGALRWRERRATRFGGAFLLLERFKAWKWRSGSRLRPPRPLEELFVEV